MDKRCLPPMPYFDDARFAEREVGLWNLEKMTDDHEVVTDQLSWTSSNKYIASPPLGKCKQRIAKSVDSMELPGSYLLGGQKGKLKLERNFEVAERTTNLSMSSRMGTEDSAARSNFHVPQVSYVVDGNKIGVNGSQAKSSLFSSSFPEIFSRNLRLPSDDVLSGQYIDTIVSHNKEDKPFGSLGEIDAQTIGNLLPDNDDLISGVLDDLKYISQPNNDGDIEYFDPFSNVGGMELEDDASCGERHNTDVAGGISNDLGVSKVSIAGEHLYVCGHPSRTLFVRNIDSNIEDSELRVLFEQFGDIRTLYTDCKHSGFVVISYYDIRAACNAIRALQNKPVRCWKLDIQFSTSKDNQSGKDINQGTLVVFNIDSSVSNDYLCRIFGAYGEIKEIRETPHRHHLKFIEFYDVRAAEAALHALRRSDISGKQFKLEPSHIRSGRKCLIQYYSPDKSRHCWQNNSSPAQCSVSISHEETVSSGIDNVNIQDLCSSARAPISSITKNAFHHKISSSIPNRLPSLEGGISVGSIGEPSHPLGQTEFGFQSVSTVHPHSFPEYHGGLANFAPFNSSYMGANMVADIHPRPSDRINNRHVSRVGFSGHSVELNEGAFGSSGNGSCPLRGHQYVQGNSNSYYHLSTPMMWQDSRLLVNSAQSQQRLCVSPTVPSHMLNTVSPINHLQQHLCVSPTVPSHMLNTFSPPINHQHFGSAPAVDPSICERRYPYMRKFPEASSFHPGSLGFGDSRLHLLEHSSNNMFPHVAGNCMEMLYSSANVGLHSPQQRSHMFSGGNPMILLSSSFGAPNEWIRDPRYESSLNQADNKKRYELDTDRIVQGEDIRTTLMIKNIPNKYTSKMLLAAIDEHHQGTYDFIYLPIDFKNKCNVGYAFINMINPLQIIPFHQAFNGKKWEKFNSEKVASLAYARIQGKSALIAHFQNSSLMNEDKRCRPLLFHSNGPNAGEQEPFPRTKPGKTRTSSNEENHHGSPSTFADEEIF